MGVVRWLLFAWGAICALIAGWYAARLGVEIPSRQSAELGFGLGFGLLYGYFPWLALPVLVTLAWRKLSRGTRLIQLAPSAAGLLLVGVVYLSGHYG